MDGWRWDIVEFMDAVHPVLLGECNFDFPLLSPPPISNFEASKNLINQIISHLGDRCVEGLVCCCRNGEVAKGGCLFHLVCCRGNREVAKRGCHVHLTMSNNQRQLQFSLCKV